MLRVNLVTKDQHRIDRKYQDDENSILILLAKPWGHNYTKMLVR